MGFPTKKTSRKPQSKSKPRKKKTEAKKTDIFGLTMKDWQKPLG